MFRKLMAGAAALAMTTSPVLAAAPTTQSAAAKLSLKNAVPASARASSQAGKSKAAGGLLVPILVGVAVVAGIIIIADGDNDADSN
jgi:hypothetical protein